MNAIDKARREVKQAEAVLSKLSAERARVSGNIVSLKVERTAAVRALAGGDGSQRKKILQLEARIKDTSDFFQGLNIELTEAEKTLEAAKEALRRAEGFATQGVRA